jgi:hypothetical protein
MRNEACFPVLIGSMVTAFGTPGRAVAQLVGMPVWNALRAERD